MPQALAVVHGAVREGNAALAAGDKAAVAERYGEVRAMLGVLGLDPLAGALAGRAPGRPHRRWSTRWSGSRWSSGRRPARARTTPAADAIRDRLAAAGIAVEDTPAGPRWTLPTARDASRLDSRSHARPADCLSSVTPASPPRETA